jgi:hypothetical protein
MHTRQNNKYHVSQKHSCFSCWWAHSCPKQVEIYKYTKNKLCTKLALFTRLCRDAQSTKHKTLSLCSSLNVRGQVVRACKTTGIFYSSIYLKRIFGKVKLVFMKFLLKFKPEAYLTLWRGTYGRYPPDRDHLPRVPLVQFHVQEDFNFHNEAVLLIL